MLARHAPRYLLAALLLTACSLNVTELEGPSPISLSEFDTGQPDPQRNAAALQQEEPESAGESQPEAASVQQEESESAGDQRPPSSSQSEAPPGDAQAGIPPQAPVGPESYPAGINPLTGLPVSDPEVLQDCPLLVAVSNFPPSSRQALSGLSVAAQVWETYIGEGMTRFLAVFYGDYAEQLQAILANPLVDGGDFAIGPVRSGRVAFEDIKMLFPGATLITAGASPEVAQQLTGVRTAYGTDPEDISSAGLEASRLQRLACRHGRPPSLAGLAFDPAPAAGGSPAAFVQIVYNTFNQVGWEYDAGRGAYLRSQDAADGSGTLYPILENLTGEQLAFENVLVMFAKHQFIKPTIVEINLMFVDHHRGLLFRDGQVLPVEWSTLRGQLRLKDNEGDPVPLKPGKTFLEVVSYQTTWNPDSMIVRYHNP